MIVTTKQKKLLQHMLGADSRYLKKQWGFRNHFCAGEKGDPDRIELDKMEIDGLVKSEERINFRTFWATKKGAEAIGFKPYQLRKTDLAT